MQLQLDLNSSPNSYNMLSLNWQPSCLQKGCIISLYLGKCGTWAEAAERPAVSVQRWGVDGGGRDITSHFCPPVFLHTVATMLESLPPVELSWY